MDEREDLKSIVAYLPLVLRSSSLFWPSKVVEALKALAAGPIESRVQSGEVLSVAICDLRSSLSLSDHPLPPSALDGYALFFDELMSRAEAAKWFEEVFPAMANMLLKLPCLLETHYRSADHLLAGAKTGLRLLPSQQLGIVFLSQELIGALLACSFFCLFPVSSRDANYLPTINFDQLFASLYENYTENQEHKIKCILHYFERISSSMPVGFVSFERKVRPLNHLSLSISYPEPVFWSKSLIPLCRFEVHDSGLIEDQPNDALEVDFANKYLGGGALHRGCVQEEIRFMVNPELIAGMLFLPSMADNEAIEIVGAERFSNYIGYASSFRYSGDHVDKKNVDIFGRRKTRIVAIDALSWPGMRQYKLKSLLRETNKAFCGFIDQSKYCQYERVFLDKGLDDGDNISKNDLSFDESSSATIKTIEETSLNELYRISAEKTSQCLDNEDISVGVVTGNWGCGAFGGDPELKSIIQWLAASQALRPFVSYYKFGLKELQYLDQVTQWISSHKWRVGDLWTMLVEYSSQRLKGDTNLGFFNWLLPSLTAHDEPKSALLNTP